MSSEVRGPDRIYVSKRVRLMLDDMKESNYFGLSDHRVTRSELFLFAIALGMDVPKSKLESKESLVLENAIGAQTKASMYALFIDSAECDNIDSVADKGKVYSLAEEYANTGFSILEDYISRCKDEALIWTLIQEMDEQYKLLMPNNS